MKSTDVLNVMQQVADWQLANPSKHPLTDWTVGALYNGITALGDLSPEPRYREAMMDIGRKTGWQPGPRVWHADDHCVGQMYVEMYQLYRDPAMIAPLRERFDDILAHPAEGTLEFKQPFEECCKRWSWCDALFMAPPAWIRLWAATGDARYLDFMVANWWKTSDYLYDPDEHLYYRDDRYFEKREANGKKVFWSRGNGWVMGGLVRVLQVLPADHPARGRFVAQFREMAEKIRAIQLDNGFWSPSLLNPGDFAKRETSGTGFFCYALAWGVNQGLLERERFEPAARRAWAGLADCVDPDGKLTHVQPIGDSPYTFDETKTEAYGVGAFLLAGSEIYRMQLAAECPQATVEVRSVLDQLRPRETIEVDWAVVVKELSGASPATVAVMDGVAARWIPSQVTEAGGRPEALLFQADFLPGQTRSFSFILVKKRVEPTPTFTTYGRFVPERLDDFAWENDRIAFRIYGPALEASDSPDFLSSSGIDVWAKRTRVPVIDRWYKAGTYHEDHGEGLDNYKVGPSRGCGGLGVWDGKMLVCSKNYVSWKVLANGPVRTTFELTYAPWDTPTGKVSEVKRVSLDAGANLNRIESVLATESPLTVGVGLAENRGTGKVVKDEKSGLLCYWEDPDPNGNGSIGTAILADPRQVEGFAREAGPQLKGMAQNVMLLEATPRGGKATLTYYAGAGWDKSDDFADAVAWEAYLRHFAARLAHPLKVEAK